MKIYMFKSRDICENITSFFGDDIEFIDLRHKQDFPEEWASEILGDVIEISKKSKALLFFCDEYNGAMSEIFRASNELANKRISKNKADFEENVKVAPKFEYRGEARVGAFAKKFLENSGFAL